MARILVFRKIDIENKTNYDRLTYTVEKKFGGICPNFGNKLWYQGIISEITVDENTIDYYVPTMDVDVINEQYDMLLYPMANIFSIDYADGLSSITSFIIRLKIPVFIISCGVQAKNYDELDMLIGAIGDVSKRFIKAVYNTGGEFALRGYFTAEFFKRLGFNSPAVVGCPSLFQIGKQLNISNKKVGIEEFKVALNGLTDLSKPIMKKYDSLYYDQEAFFDFMYNKNYYAENSNSLFYNLKWIKSSGLGIDLVDWIDKDRIRLLADIWDWQHSLQNEGISFSFGTRIHGNIMSILSGVPALIVGLDARVKEMAEYYEIPNIDLNEAMSIKSKDNLYEVYLEIDYTNFNKHFPEKYKAFNDFLVKCGIVKKAMNSDNRFLNCSSGDYPVSAFPISKNRVNAIKRNLWLYRALLKLIK